MRAGHAAAACLLMERGADLEARTQGQGFTALIIAAYFGKAAVIAALLDHGADPTASGSDSHACAVVEVPGGRTGACACCACVGCFIWPFDRRAIVLMIAL